MARACICRHHKPHHLLGFFRFYGQPEMCPVYCHLCPQIHRWSSAMAGKKRPLHELVPVCRNGKAYVFRSKWVCLGKWEGDEPSAEAVARLISL